MAQETNQTQVPLLCSTGCGFYGNARTNGMCSICYKDFLQRQNANGRVTETVSVPAVSNLSSLDESLSASSSTVTPTGVAQEEEASGASVQVEPKTQEVTGSDESTQPATPEPDKSKPKKNRCFTCRKKLGLTGFDCRCGNMFCGIHRYSDVHNCTFDYKTDGAEKIRKENPVVVGEKITKI
ncbi:AN1-type zinc finger protein 6 [Neoarius graeffei]|uniref:AN1-type zinc finger protein 6 n=1 Tax=Neoarius graeffei TaxID=443677 RepID=UPI00298C3779|nr:AN1-type zinc finger protein 6 [Neoarius graeffei]XP_060797089.1 AN1-type zinc finger protein 6 [Neoarius graeffei]